MNIKVGPIIVGQHLTPENEKGLGEPYTKAGKFKAVGLSTVRACALCQTIFRCRTTTSTLCGAVCDSRMRDKRKMLKCVECGVKKHSDHKRRKSLEPFQCVKCKMKKVPHGTRTKYQQGCKCTECLAANVRSGLEWQAQYKEVNGKSHSAVWHENFKEKHGVASSTLRARRFKEENGYSYYRGSPSGVSIPISAKDRGTIYERDGWVCQLCLEPVDRFTTDHRKRPSLDHIVPQSYFKEHGLEVDHTPMNLRLSHLGCNAKRQDAKGEDLESLLKNLDLRKEVGHA